MSCFGSTNLLRIPTLEKKVCNFVGGVFSPLLANIALHGLEAVVKHAGGAGKSCKGGKQVTHQTHCIQYADDFVVFNNRHYRKYGFCSSNACNFNG